MRSDVGEDARSGASVFDDESDAASNADAGPEKRAVEVEQLARAYGDLADWEDLAVRAATVTGAVRREDLERNVEQQVNEQYATAEGFTMVGDDVGTYEAGQKLTLDLLQNVERAEVAIRDQVATAAQAARADQEVTADTYERLVEIDEERLRVRTAAQSAEETALERQIQEQTETNERPLPLQRCQVVSRSRAMYEPPLVLPATDCTAQQALDSTARRSRSCSMSTALRSPPRRGLA